MATTQNTGSEKNTVKLEVGSKVTLRHIYTGQVAKATVKAITSGGSRWATVSGAGAPDLDVALLPLRPVPGHMINGPFVFVSADWN